MTDLLPCPFLFPIMLNYGGHKAYIPWAMIASHEDQAKKNHGGQTLIRLAERGGLSWAEAYWVLNDQRFEMTVKDDLARSHVLKMWEAWNIRHTPPGFVLVPVEPTEEMYKIAIDASYEENSDLKTIYTAMVKSYVS